MDGPRECKIAGHKINIQKYVVLYTLNYQKEKTSRKSHSQLHQKIIKYMGIKLMKEVKDLYLENCKITDERY